MPVDYLRILSPPVFVGGTGENSPAIMSFANID
jgi:hypothetical protein